MKTLFSLFLALALSITLGAAEVAKTLKLTQVNDAGTGFAPRDVTGTANNILGFDASGHPTSYAQSVFVLTAGLGSGVGTWLGTPSWTNFVAAITGATPFSSTTKADVLEAALFAADAGSTDAYAITLSPAITAYVTGAHYRFKANTANTGAATININAVGAKSIVKAAGGITTALADNDIQAGQWVDLVYDGTNMQMQSTLGNASGGGGGSGTVNSGSANQLAYYAGGGTTVSGLTTANSGLLVTNGSGVPSITSTVPPISVNTPSSSAIGTGVSVYGTGQDDSGVGIRRSAGNAGGPSFEMSKSRGTIASPSQTLSGDELGGIYAGGYTSSNAWSPYLGWMYFKAAENFTSSAQGTNWTLATTSIGGTSPTTRVTVASNGDTVVTSSTSSSSTSSGALVVSGGVGVAGNINSGGTGFFAGLIRTTGISDTSGNEVVKFSAAGSAVNEITVTTAATGGGVAVTATGDDSNINLSLSAKGTGTVKLTNPVTVGTASTSTPGTALSAYGSGQNDSGISIRRAAGNGGGPSFFASKSRGTIASPSQTLSGDELGGFYGGGYTSSNAWVDYTAWIVFKATQDFTSSAQGTKFTINTTANGATSPTERMSVGQDGQIAMTAGIASTTSTTGTLIVTGGVGVSGAINSGDDMATQTIGKTFKVKSGSNAKAGTFTLSSGAVTVSNTSVTANSVVVMSLKTASGSITAAPYLTTITATTGFDVAGGAGDNSTYNYVILEVN